MIDLGLLQQARMAHKAGNYHFARDLYQQIAYSYNDFTEPEKEAFTKEVAEFAGDDPMYRDILNLVITQIQQAQEPILQSKLTSAIKRQYGERGTELLRYVLYYADYRDELKRVKKGRSYLLFLPSMQIEPSAPKAIKSSQKLNIETDEETEKREALARLERLRAKDAALLKEVRAKQEIEKRELERRKAQEAQKQKIEGKIACFIFLLFLILFLVIKR